MFEADQIKYVQLTLSTPEEIKKNSRGEVKRNDTLHPQTDKPVDEGLFCQRIFGPIKDFECGCGKYRGQANRGIICEKCRVQVLRSRVRRERFGHISFALPVTHIWHFRKTGSRIALLLDMSYKDLENIIYYHAYCITAVNDEARKANYSDLEKVHLDNLEKFKKELETAVKDRQEKLQKDLESNSSASAAAKKTLEDHAAKYIKQVTDKYDRIIQDENDEWDRFVNMNVGDIQLDTRIFRRITNRFGDYFECKIGAEFVKYALENLDLSAEIQKVREIISQTSGAKKIAAQKRLNVLNSFFISGNSPVSMVLTIIPVLPAGLRQIKMMEGGRPYVDELTELYQDVINANNQLKKKLADGDSPLIIHQTARTLQEAVDSLIDNGRRGRATARHGGSALRSLSDKFGGTKQNGEVSFKSKNARFRDNLLGKRVDFSGRSVIVVGPELKMHQCGLPKSMALELFRPFIIKRLIELNICQNPRAASRLFERPTNDVWDILEEVIREHPVLLNRAPTLHRLGIQAFEPQLVEGNAIKLHPLACAAFNADFDGDQMAVHVPLSVEAQAEARVLMLGSGNILKPSDGKTITEPSQDMIVGLYFLTRIISEEDRKPGTEADLTKLRSFSSKDEAIMAKDLGQIAINDEIRIRLNIGKSQEFIVTSLGRVIFNEVLPVGYPFVNEMVDKKKLGALIDDLVAKKYPVIEINRTLDAMKEYGFHWATYSGTSISFNDIVDSPKKSKLMEIAEKDALKIQNQYDQGLITEDERRLALIDIWAKTTDEVANDMRDNFDSAKKNSLNSIVKSGARGNWMQVRQISGMRGLVANPRGEIIPRPVKSNYSEGLSVQEYFISSHGARKGVADTAFKTANSGYLTRRIVETGYPVVITEFDCSTKEKPTKGFTYSFADESGAPNASEARKAIWGRYLSAPVEVKGKVIAESGKEVTADLIDQFVKAGVTEVTTRSIMTCKAPNRTLCSVCYGNSMATGRLVDVGEVVGLIAAQSIGEPGTQLTMRTFHTGGVATSGADLTTQGLPRLIQIIDAVKVDPKVKGLLAPADGIVKVNLNKDLDHGHDIIFTPSDKALKSKTFRNLSRAQKLLVKDGEKVTAGQRLTDGELNLQDILDVRGEAATKKHIRDQIQGVFSSQGIDIHDKHLEIIINGMLGFVEITDIGDIPWTKLRPVPRDMFARLNKEAVAKGLKPATAHQIVIGAREIGSHVESWLSSASYIKPIQALSDAAVEAKKDNLTSLKENVIVGKLIPAGTGLAIYKQSAVSVKDEFIPTFANYDDFDYSSSGLEYSE